MKHTQMTFVGWLASTFVAAMTMSAYVFTNFETKENSRVTKSELKETLGELRDDIKEIRRIVEKH